jgi:CSLREA domain-containing protein/uncharacterized repeat protein (TIGR01451 family)
MKPMPLRALFKLLPILFFPIGAQALTFVVTTTADGNNGACTLALCTLRDAVIAANTAGGANAITLPSNANPYLLTLTGANEGAAATGDLDVTTGDLTINGGGAATTIIDGGAIDRVFEVFSPATLTLNDVTVRNGSTATDTSTTLGGGIAALNTTLTLNNSIVTNNNGGTGSLAGPGGGIFATTLIMTNSTVSNNHTRNQGGGIAAGSATISGSTISGNQSTGDQAGGLFLINGTSNITNSTITGNTAVGEGGAIYLNGTTNANSPAILNITDSTISNNSAGNTGTGGGLYILSFATVTITGSTLTGNVAGGTFARDGGAIFNTGNLTMVNSTVSGNTATEEGGGIKTSTNSTVTIQSSTIASNTAPGRANLANSGTMTLTNTIIANPVTGPNCGGTIGNGGGNMQFPGTTCGAAITTADPLLGPLANNGGPTQTRTLLTGSPAINAAVGCPPPATDQRGIARPVGPACDIGSVEVVVVTAPTISKSFTPATVTLNGTSALSFTVSNPGNQATLNNISFTDSLPAGLVVATPNGLTGSCLNGTITAVAGSNTISLSGMTGAPGASCTFGVNVIGTTAGVKNNSVTVTSTEATGNTATASITVLAPPSISKSFGAATIPLNGSTSLTFVITNPNATTALTGVAFTDTLPAGLTVATPNGLTGSCGGGTITATAGSASVSLSGATVAGGAQCTFAVNVTGTTLGVKSNSVTVSSSNGGQGNTGSATVSVVNTVTISKTFGVTTLLLNGTTSLTFTVTNPNAAAGATGVAFTDTLPAGLVVATPNGLTGTCGAGTITATSGSGTVALTGGTIAASGSCSFAVNVTGTTAGVKNNSVTVSSTETGQGNTATASVTVIAPATLAKAFGATTVAPGGTTTLTFTLTNPNPALTLTGVGFTDVFPGGLAVSTPNGLTGTCGGGTITAAAGSTSVALSGATLAAGASCTFAVNVTATGSGTVNNVTSAVASVEGGSGTAATASLLIVPPPAANIPTLQEWMIVLLSVLLWSAAASILVRRQKRNGR